jgi:hypothetical protein
MLRRFLPLVALLTIGGTAAAQVQDWATPMFKETRHDFGTVARGAAVEYRFELKNPYNETVHIASATSSCHCTIPTITKQVLKTHEVGEIVATIDTVAFNDRRGATITVKFDQPIPAIAQLHVSCYIRPDVVVTPGEVRFGPVRQGGVASQKLAISYAGQPAWQIVDVRSACPYLEAVLAQTQRSQGRVGYELTVGLKPNAPPGSMKEYMFLITNDANPENARVPVQVEVNVIPPLTVSPSPLLLGVARPGQTLSKNLVVRGDRPFRVLEVLGPDARFRFGLPQGASQMHLVPVVFTAGRELGKTSGKIRIRTDMPGNEAIEASVDCQVNETDKPAADGDWPPPEAAQ